MEDYETSEFHHDPLNHYLMLQFVLAYIPWNTRSYHELPWSCRVLRNDLVPPSATTLSHICWRVYSLTNDAIIKQLPSRNNVSLALDGCTMTNKRGILSVMTDYMIQSWALPVVQHAVDEVHRLCTSIFESSFMMSGQGPTY